MGARPRGFKRRDVADLASALYLDSREDVDHYLEVMNELSTEALAPARSAALLAEVTKET